MCVNCNLIAPITHEICDLLGIPRNVYGVRSNELDILQKLTYEPWPLKTADENVTKLHNYLVENKDDNGISLIQYIEKVSNVVEQHFINYVLMKYFVTNNNWKPAPEIVDSFKVPAHLLSSDPQMLRRCFGKTQYHQIELIPYNLIKKYKVTKDKADAYGIYVFPQQPFYKPGFLENLIK